MKLPTLAIILVDQDPVTHMCEWNFCLLMRICMRAQVRKFFLVFWLSHGPVKMPQGHENKENKTSKTKIKGNKKKTKLRGKLQGKERQNGRGTSIGSQPPNIARESKPASLCNIKDYQLVNYAIWARMYLIQFCFLDRRNVDPLIS